MDIQRYLDAFSSLVMHTGRDGRVSPHKICMLLAVMDLVENGVITENRIYYNDGLKRAFSSHFDRLNLDQGMNRPYVPCFYLKSSGFWHHEVRSGMERVYKDFTERGNTERRFADSVEYISLDPELFEYFRSASARGALKAALGENFNDERRDRFLVPASGFSWRECELIVRDYFDMLESELKGASYNESEHVRGLLGDLSGHTAESVKSTYRGISAILMEAGVPAIDGYKPSLDYQQNILPDVVGAQLAKSGQLEGTIERVTRQSTSKVPGIDEILNGLRLMKNQNDHKYLVEPPEPGFVHNRDRNQTDYRTGRYKPKKTDYLEREIKNQSLGLSGEQFAVNYEKARLISVGKESLADRVDHVSQTDDSLGYDIRSYEESGEDRFIEVKTTNYARHTRFWVTKNELNVSEELDEKYHLYRVFSFNRAPRFFQAQGDLKRNFDLDAALFTADIR